MPASLPGATLAENLANPSQGRQVAFDLMHGPKGSPFDRDQAGRASTGGLSTGIGFGGSTMSAVIGPTAPQSIKDKGFQDDYTPGLTKPDGTASPNSTIMHIGGGRMITNPDAAQRVSVPFVPSPYTAGWGIGVAGNGGARDAGAGPAYTGFPMKIVTATGNVANGAVIETGFANRTGVAMVAGQSAFGVGAASPVPALRDDVDVIHQNPEPVGDEVEELHWMLRQHGITEEEADEIMMLGWPETRPVDEVPPVPQEEPPSDQPLPPGPENEPDTDAIENAPPPVYREPS